MKTTSLFPSTCKANWRIAPGSDIGCHLRDAIPLARNSDFADLLEQLDQLSLEPTSAIVRLGPRHVSGLHERQVEQLGLA